MISSGSESQKSFQSFDDLPVRMFRKREENDAVNWQAMLFLSPSASESEKPRVFWELRGVFNHFKWGKCWHVSTWADKCIERWAKLWRGLDLSQDGYRCSLRAAENMLGNLGKKVNHRHASQAVMATENLLALLTSMCRSGNPNKLKAQDVLKKLCSAAVVHPGFMIPDTRSFCHAGRDADGWCIHLRSGVQRLEEARHNGTLGAIVAEILGVLGDSPSCHAMLEFKKKLIVAVSSAFAAQWESFADVHTNFEPIRGKKRALVIAPQWCKEVAVDRIKEGKCKSALASGRMAHGKKMSRTYAGATVSIMSRYAWNLPKAFSQEFQLNCSFDASWKSRRDMVSMIVWGPRTRRAGWAPHQE